MIHSHLHELPLRDAHVLLRADLNFDPSDVSIHYRLSALIPTLAILHDHGAHTLLVSHRGQAEEKLSNESLLPLLKACGHPAVFAQTIAQAHAQLKERPLVLLQNIRFWPGECAAPGDPARVELANQLRNATQLYVTDAFGTLHRNDCSIVDLPYLYDKRARTIGPLIEKELQKLEPLRDSPARPYVVIVGGAKIDTKLPLVPDLLRHADTLIILPALSFALDQARGLKIGASLFDKTMAPIARAIVQLTDYARVVTPRDYLVAQNSFSGPTTYVSAGQLADNHVGVSFGPKTLEICLHAIADARTIFFTGVCGDIHRQQTVEQTQQLIASIPASHRASIIAGGDTITAVQQWGMAEKFSFISTGGGASLTFIAGHDLPGLAPFKK